MANIVNLKLGVYGEGGVGKTSLVNVFLGMEAPKNYSPTINSKVSKKEYLLKNTGVTFKLNIWDVGGNRAVNPIINNAFFSDVDIALIVFDLSRPELTIKSYEKNFLDRINRFSETPLALIVGNKLDKLLVDDEFKNAIQNYLSEEKNFLITSATSEINVNNCFELLTYTFLKKSEILLPDLVPENSSTEFLELIGKQEEQLRGQLVNLNSINQKIKFLKPKIDTEEAPSQEEDKEREYQGFIQQEIEKIIDQKVSISDEFLEIIIKTEKEISQLAKQNLKSIVESVENLKNVLEISKKNSEQIVETLIRLKREERELSIISSKLKKDETDEMPKAPVDPFQIEDKPIGKPEVKLLEVEVKSKGKPEVKPLEIEVKPIGKPEVKPLEVEVKPKVTKPQLKEVRIVERPIKSDPKIELYNKYERNNPGKRAVYRGKETKRFLEWKKNQKI